jgi:Polysaccharide biosynthesis protein
VTTFELMKEAPRLAEWRFEFVWPMALRLYFAIKPFVSNLFWIDLGVSGLASATMALLAPLIAWFFREPPLTAISAWFAMAFILERFAVCRADASPRGSVPGANSRASSRKPLVRPWVLPC